MGSKPNTSWGSSDSDAPVTRIAGELILPVPFITAAGTRFRDKMEVAIGTIAPDCEVYYTLDGSVPTGRSLRYTAPLVLTGTATLKAAAFREDTGYSFPVQADFVKLDPARGIDITSKCSPAYHAGGPEALIDGQRGAANWRLDGWQGYQGTDFEAVVDLGKSQPIGYLAAGFVRDVRSWIWMPRDATFYVSNDGASFTRIARVVNTIPYDDYRLYYEDFVVKVSASARYVKVRATNYGKIPEWHSGAGGNAFIFIDEIEIRE